jgi:putative ABC transport system permease protein
MNIPLKYSRRSLRVRWRSTLATVFSIALVVAVFILVMALANGLRMTLSSTGDARNLLVIRKGALAESSSQVTVDEVRRTQAMEGIALDREASPLASAEVIVLVTMERSHRGKAHVQVRGLGRHGVELRPSIQLVEGRWFQPGTRECVVSRSVARRFRGCNLGQEFSSGKHVWRVVGIFDARRTAYDSEIWVDAEEAREAFHRAFYCSVVLRPMDGRAALDLARRVEGDRRMRLRALRETDYYQEQMKTAGPIQVFGLCLSLVMGIGAVFSAMNTMFAAVGSRGRDIGTLRVLGFRRRSIYLSFLLESILLALVGGMIGCLLSLPLQGLATGTFNWRSFAEVAFEFRITGELLAGGLAFAGVIGLVGGLLPARLAAHRPLLDALRTN